MEDREEDPCTATNLNADDSVELRDIVFKVVSTDGTNANALFPRFAKLVSFSFSVSFHSFLFCLYYCTPSHHHYPLLSTTTNYHYCR